MQNHTGMRYAFSTRRETHGTKGFFTQGRDVTEGHTDEQSAGVHG
jgi:hypothetical protein